MNYRRLLPLILPALLSLGACHRSAPPATEPPSAQPPTVPAASTAPGGGMDGVTKPLLQLLADEKTNRPSGTPSAETVFAALDKAGIHTQDPSQVLGRMVGAAFCENAHTAEGVVVSVCEYKDADTLARGRAYSEKTFAKALPNRALVSNKNTLLTLNPPDASPAAKAQVDTIGRLFAAL